MFLSDLFEPPQEMNVGFSTDVGGVQLTIKQGDITEEEVDAIVTSANSDFDFTKGQSICLLIIFTTLDSNLSVIFGKLSSETYHDY